MKLYIQQETKLIGNQLTCLYRHLGAISDGAAFFLTCTRLISQQGDLQSTNGTRQLRLCLSQNIKDQLNPY